MKKINLIFYLIILLVTSCADDSQKIIKFSHSRDIVLELPDNFLNSPRNSRFFILNDTLYYAFSAQKHLLLYNLDNSKLVRNIKISKKHYLYIHNFDSIFVLIDPYDYNYGDSSLFLIDFNGKIKKYYSLDNAPVLTGNKKNMDLIRNAAYIYGLEYKDGKLFLYFDKYYYNYVHDSAYNSVKIPLSAHIDLATDSLILHNIYEAPDLENNRVINKADIFVYPYISDDFLYHCFVYTPRIIRYNIKTGQKKIVSIKSDFIDTIITKKETSVRRQNNIYTNMTYIPYYKQYVRYALVNNHTDKKSLCILTDSNFCKLGEFVLPKGVYINENNIINDKVYCYNRDKTFKNPGKLILSIYDFTETDTSKYEYYKSINIEKKSNTDNMSAKSCTVNYSYNNFIDKKYLETFLTKKIGKNNFKVIIVPVFMSCHSCVDYILKSYAINYRFFSKSNIYLIAVGDNFPAMEEKLNDFGLSVGNTVIMDSTSHYFNAFRNFTLEHLIIIRNKEIEFAKDYYPNELDSLMLKVSTF